MDRSLYLLEPQFPFLLNEDYKNYSSAPSVPAPPYSVGHEVSPVPDQKTCGRGERALLLATFIWLILLPEIKSKRRIQLAQ